MLTGSDVDRLLAALTNSGGNEARDALVADIRKAHSEAVEAGTVTAETPAAAVFTRSELDERGLGKIRASRNGNGPIAKVGTLPGTDPEQVLVVLNPEDDEAEDSAE